MAELLEMLAENMRLQTQILKEMQTGGAAGQGMKTKAPASSGNFTELHGNGSLWGSYPIERDVISAHLSPSGGLANRVPWLPSVTENPLFASLVGYTGTTGSEPTNPCDAAPHGYVLGCNITAMFGRVMRDTNTIEIDKVMLRKNRGDFTDLVLRGRLLDPNSPFVPSKLDQAGVMNIVTKSEMVTVGVNLDRKLSVLTWQGTPANNTAGGGYKEFPGLDSQIATGILDAHTGNTCPALDSDVKDFAYNNISGADGRSIVEYISMIEFYTRMNAENMGLMPVSWVFVMRPEIWQELTEVWPCQYNTNKCSTAVLGDASRVFIDGRDNIAQRDSMRSRRQIEVNGYTYDVILDYGIYEHSNITNSQLLPGQYASSIYFVPLTITGSFPVTYFEHVDYRAAMPDISLLRNQEMFWTDDGRYMWAYEGSNFCFLLKAKIEPRIVLRTPQLAAKIQHVKYSPLQHIRSPYPDNPYFSAGGVSLRGDESLFSIWN